MRCTVLGFTPTSLTMSGCFMNFDTLSYPPFRTGLICPARQAKHAGP